LKSVQVLVGGNSAAREDLKQSCLAVEGMTTDIFTPSNDELATIGDDIDSFSLRLDDELISGLKMRRVEDFDIVKLDGSILIPDVSSIPVIARKAAADSGAFDHAALVKSFYATTPSPPPEDAKPRRLSPLTPNLYIGDVRLALLKARLLALNIPSSFAGEGILVCGPAPSAKQKQSKDPKMRLMSKSRASSTPELSDGDHSGGKVAVRKDANGHLTLEGQPGETFELVRQAVYSGLASTG
jgi:cleavage and polyadenylation specificity factor subunit 2